MSQHHSVILRVLSDLFGWPGGILLSNLVWLPIQYATFAWRLAKHHSKIHGRLDQQAEHTAALAAHLGLDLQHRDGGP